VKTVSNIIIFYSIKRKLFELIRLEPNFNIIFTCQTIFAVHSDELQVKLSFNLDWDFEIYIMNSQWG